jgi:hypothetical protein
MNEAIDLADVHLSLGSGAARVHILKGAFAAALSASSSSPST